MFYVVIAVKKKKKKKKKKKNNKTTQNMTAYMLSKFTSKISTISTFFKIFLYLVSYLVLIYTKEVTPKQTDYQFLNYCNYSAHYRF